MEKFIEKYLGQVLVVLLTAGIISFFSVSFQVQKDSELTRQKLDQLDEMMMDFKKDVKDLSIKVDQIAIMNMKIFDLERRLEKLENARYRSKPND